MRCSDVPYEDDAHEYDDHGQWHIDPTTMVGIPLRILSIPVQEDTLHYEVDDPLIIRSINACYSVDYSKEAANYEKQH